MKSTYYTNLREDIINLVPKREFTSLLEIGGGDFKTLALLKNQFSANAIGVDIVNLEKEDSISYIQGSIEDEEVQKIVQNNDYDLVLANDVIEHLIDPERTLVFLNQVTQNNGYLILSVPNIRQIRAFYNIFILGTFPKNDSGLFDKTHIQWFCKSDIESLVTRSGYKIESIFNQGRLVPRMLKSTIYAQLFGLHTVVVARK